LKPYRCIYWKYYQQ